MRNNKKSMPLLCVIALVSLSVSGMIAYFTYKMTNNNTITIGENTIEISEEFAPPKELKQGINVYKKQVKIENTGLTKAFVRVYAAFSDSSVADKSFIAASKPTEIIYLDDDADFDTVVVPTMDDAGYKKSDVFWKENGPSNDWIYIPDTDATLGGYFYYTKKVAPGESTSELIDTVATYFEEASDIADYELIVYAESVQTADKNGIEFDDADYKEAWTEYLTRK